jgi:transcriptional regulator with XRE-family HTH domain
MLELGMTKEEFATKVGCSVATVYNMLAGRRVNERNAFRAAQILGLDFRKILPKKKPA